MKKKDEKIRKDDLQQLTVFIVGLAVVYGPIDVYDAIDKIYEYDVPWIRGMDEEDVETIVEEIAEKSFLKVFDGTALSLFSEDEITEALKDEALRNIFDADMEKTFASYEEIQAYGDLLNYRNEDIDRLHDFISTLKLKKGLKNEDVFNEVMAVIFKMFDYEQFLRRLEDRCREDYDETELLKLIDAVAFDFPRGFLHGYSFRELSEMMTGEDFLDRMTADRISGIDDPCEFGHYTYEECQQLAKKLSETDIFADFCSDNIIELLINGREIFVQLLGYYNNDRCVIIYGDRRQMEYNYHFISSDMQDYPDIPYRINYCEVCLDDAGGFLTPELADDLKSRKIGYIPLFFEFDPLQGPIMPSDEKIDLAGAVLESLLKIYEELEEKIAERCVEGNLYQIVQLYLGKKEIGTGDYTYLELGDPVLPFKPAEPKKRKIKARNTSDIGIGIYAVVISDEEGASYLNIVYDYQSDLIVGFRIIRESEMSGVCDAIIDILEENSLLPVSFTFNNEFAAEACDALFDFYDVDFDPAFDSDTFNTFYDDIDVVRRDSDTVLH